MRKQLACSPSPDGVLFSLKTFQSSFSPRTQFKIFISLAFGLLCLGLSAPLTLAQSKGKRAEERARRVETKKQTNQRQAKGRETSSKRESVARRENAAAKRDDAIRVVAPPLVRKTVIVSTPQDNMERQANRQALVNDIVIISEAPVTSRLPHTTRTMGGGSQPSIWPVAGIVRGGFGYRRNPFGGSGSEFHKGQDISAPTGAPVIATADGVVVTAGWQRGYGQVVYVDHGNGLSTRYGHLSRISVVEGQTVKRGELLGLVGSTGRSTGPHLHYEVRVNGQATNPLPYLPSIPTPVVK